MKCTSINIKGLKKQSLLSGVLRWSILSRYSSKYIEVYRKLKRVNETATSPRVMHWMASKRYQWAFRYLLTDVPYWTFKLTRYSSSIDGTWATFGRYITDSWPIYTWQYRGRYVERHHEWTIDRYIGRHSTEFSTCTRLHIDRYSAEYLPIYRLSIDRDLTGSRQIYNW